MRPRSSLLPRDFLIRGLLAGLIAACAAFAVAYVVGEPPLRAAIALEDTAGGLSHGPESGPGTGQDSGADEATPASGEVEVPRSLQSTAGLLTGLLVAGVTLGGLVGLVSAVAMGRLGRLRPRASTLAVAAIGFLTVYAVPFLLYPPNPPAVGSGDTIGLRSARYAIFMAISLIAAVTAVLGGRRLAARLGGWYAALVAVAGYLVVMGVVMVLLPQFDEVPVTFPPAILYDFRQASFLTQLTLWSVLGVALAELVGRLAQRRATPDRALSDVAA